MPFLGALHSGVQDCATYNERLPKEEKAESDDEPLIPNPPLKTDISGFFDEDEDIEEFESSLFGNDDDEDSKDTSKSDKNDADEIDAALALELFGPDDASESEDKSEGKKRDNSRLGLYDSDDDDEEEAEDKSKEVLDEIEEFEDLVFDE